MISNASVNEVSSSGQNYVDTRKLLLMIDEGLLYPLCSEGVFLVSGSALLGCKLRNTFLLYHMETS